jgi:hypothetical protein
MGVPLNKQNAIPVYLVDGSGVTPGDPTSPGQSATLPAGTDRSGTIAAGGTAQTLAPANANRRYLRGQNLSTGDLWLNEVGGTAAAASPSYRVPAGGTFGINTNQAVSIWGATTGQAWSATEG